MSQHYDGRALIVRAPLSDVELAAWTEHPDTFFGEISRNRRSETVLDLYDFFMESYSNTPKAKLLEFLAGARDIDQLVELAQPELASVYCERLARRERRFGCRAESEASTAHQVAPLTSAAHRRGY